jgi:hypothetical protein
MKFLLLGFALVTSLTTFASEPSLNCELFENDTLIRSATQIIDADGKAEIDLGMLDVFAFGGFAWNGYPVTMILSPAKSTNTERATDSVISSTGSTLTITCSI